MTARLCYFSVFPEQEVDLALTASAYNSLWEYYIICTLGENGLDVLKEENLLQEGSHLGGAPRAQRWPTGLKRVRADLSNALPQPGGHDALRH